MAASCTITKSGGRKSDGDVGKIVFDWTSASDGSVSQATEFAINGRIEKVVFNPGATAPTTLYDVTITDANGLDILAGQGADLSETTTTAIVPGVPLKDGTTVSVVPCVVADILTLNVTNAGDSKQGSVAIYLR